MCSTVRDLAESYLAAAKACDVCSISESILPCTHDRGHRQSFNRFSTTTKKARASQFLLSLSLTDVYMHTRSYLNIGLQLNGSVVTGAFQAQLRYAIDFFSQLHHLHEKRLATTCSRVFCNAVPRQIQLWHFVHTSKRITRIREKWASISDKATLNLCNWTRAFSLSLFSVLP